MSLNTNMKAATVNALIGLMQIGEAMAAPREEASKLTATLSKTFMTLYHDVGATEDSIKLECAAIFAAVKKKTNQPDMPEGELAGAWRQYKSDICKAARLTQDDVAIRLTHTTMSAVKKFIGTANELGKLVSMVQAFSYHARKVDSKNDAKVHAKFLADLLNDTGHKLAAYAEKHAISLVKPVKDDKESKAKPMIEAATAPTAPAIGEAAQA